MQRVQVISEVSFGNPEKTSILRVVHYKDDKSLIHTFVEVEQIKAGEEMGPGVAFPLEDAVSALLAIKDGE